MRQFCTSLRIYLWWHLHEFHIELKVKRCVCVLCWGYFIWFIAIAGWGYVIRRLLYSLHFIVFREFFKKIGAFFLYLLIWHLGFCRRYIFVLHECLPPQGVQPLKRILRQTITMSWTKSACWVTKEQLKWYKHTLRTECWEPQSEIKCAPTNEGGRPLHAWLQFWWICTSCRHFTTRRHQTLHWTSQLLPFTALPLPLNSISLSSLPKHGSIFVD